MSNPNHDLIDDADLIGKMCGLQWELAGCVSAYLGKALPPQEVREHVGSLPQLDLAALLEVLNENWSRLWPEDNNLTKRAFSCLKEVQTSVRNEWAHIPAAGVDRGIFERDLDTIGRLGDALGSETLRTRAASLGESLRQMTQQPTAVPTRSVPRGNYENQEKLRPGQLDSGVRDAVEQLDGEFTWQDIYRWLKGQGIKMSARQPGPVINQKLSRLADEGVVKRVSGPGQPAVWRSE